MKQYIDLFTPVSEGLPESPIQCLTLIDGQFPVLQYYNSPIESWTYGKTTHWLDLSKLTTKEKVESLVRRAHSCGVSYGYAQPTKTTPGQDADLFINENKNLL